MKNKIKEDILFEIQSYKVNVGFDLCNKKTAEICMMEGINSIFKQNKIKFHNILIDYEHEYLSVSWYKNRKLTLCGDSIKINNGDLL